MVLVIHFMSNINKLIGIPFKNGGRDFDGCDCMGLSILVHKEMGKTIPDFKADSTDSILINNIFENQEATGRWEKIEFPEAPCIVVMGLHPEIKNMITHVGTYIGSGNVVHTLEDSTSSVFKITHPFFKNKIKGYYKYAEDTSNGNT